MTTRATYLLMLSLLVGCSKSDPNLPGYKVGSGDAAAFVLQAATRYGARPVKTDGLPKVTGEWRYKADKDGIQIQLVGDRLADLQSLLLAAFGPPAMGLRTNASGEIASGVYAAPSIGAAIQFGHQETIGGSRYTGVVIVRDGAIR